MGRLAKCFVALLLSAGPFTTEAQNTLSIDDLVEKATLFLDTRSDSLSQLPMPQEANGEQLSLNDSAGIWFVKGCSTKTGRPGTMPDKLSASHAIGGFIRKHQACPSSEDTTCAPGARGTQLPDCRQSDSGGAVVFSKPQRQSKHIQVVL